MKPTQSNRRTKATTLSDVLVLIVILVALLWFVSDFGAYSFSKKKARQAACVVNLRVIALDFQLWSDIHGRDGGFPSTSFGGTMELAVTGNVAAVFQMITNDLSTPRSLFCPTDTNRIESTNWTTLGNSNISYFIGLDASEKNPNSILAGDDNFETKGIVMKSGVWEFSKDIPLAWTTTRHHNFGNIALADGSVQEATDTDLTNAIIKQYTGRFGFTNQFRIAIP